jgi:hypothetical protein
MFNEDDTQIMYCPVLEVSGYVKSEPKARATFETSLGQFLEYTLHKKTLSSDLGKLGRKLQGKHKPAFPPTMQQLLNQNDNNT